MKFIEEIKRNRNILMVSIISIIYPLILLNKIIFSSGYILYWDFNLPIYPDRFLDFHTQIWDTISSMAGIEGISKLFARIPFLILAYFGVDVGIIEKTMYISLFIIGIFSAYIFLRRIIILGHYPSLFISLSYVTFIHFFLFLFQYSAIWGGMIIPLIFSFFYLGMNFKKTVYIIIAGILTLTTLQLPANIFIINLIIIFYVIYNIIYSRETSKFIYYIQFIFVQIILGSYFFLPFLANIPSPESITYNIVTYEEVERLSKREYIYPLIGFPGYAFFKTSLQSFYSNTILYQLQLWFSIILMIILPFLGFVLEAIKEKTKISKLMVFFGILWFNLWQLSLGDAGLVGNIYTSVVTENSILNMIRSPGKFYVFIPFAYIGLLGLIFKSINNIKLQILSSSIFLIFIIFISFPAIIAWNNNLEPIKIPEEFKDVQKIVEKDIQADNYFRTMWYPEYYSDSDIIWSSKKKMILPFDQRSSQIHTYSYSRSGYRQYSIFYGYMMDLLSQNKTRLVSDYMNQYSIKYIIFHDDLLGKKIEYDKVVLVNLLSSDNFELKYKKNFMYLFENKNFQKRNYFNINSDFPILLETFNLQNSFNNTDRYYFFMDDGFKKSWNIFGSSKNIILNDYSNYINNLIYYNLLDFGYYHFPGKQTFFNDEKYWSIKNGWDINPKFNDFIKSYVDKQFTGFYLDFGQRIIATEQENITADYDININDPGIYIFMIRFFENKNGGNIEINLDNKNYLINTSSDKNRFIWKDIDNFYLKSGRHHILLKNINGINAVNVFGLIPKDSYYNVQQEIIDNIKNKKIIYILEIDNKIESKEIQQNIEVAKNGSYILGITGIGKFNININDNNFSIIANSTDMVYSPVLELQKINKLDILLSNNSLIESILFYPSNDNKTIDEYFYVRKKRTKINNYSKIGSNMWNVKVNATGSFMLSLAESYDSSWEAEVYKDGNKVNIVGSIPLYSVINGFWIDDIGNLEIVIIYKPQYWYNIGLIISIITFICCIGYIFYDWRKNDIWAMTLKDKLKEVLKIKKI